MVPELLQHALLSGKVGPPAALRLFPADLALALDFGCCKSVPVGLLPGGGLSLPHSVV